MADPPISRSERLREAAADRVPPGVRAAPWRALLLGAVVALTVVVVAVARLHDGGGARPATAVPRASGASGASSWAVTTASAVPSGAGSDAPVAVLGGASPSPGPTVLVVDVAGRVLRPGLVRVPAGSRVWDALLAAGGPTSGARLERLNLARPLSDGEQVLVLGAGDPVPVPVPVLPGGSPAGGPPAASGPGGTAPVDLNTATAAQLDQLPGVGPVLAGRIVAHREQHGRFTSVDELGEVPGIGPKLLAQLRPLVVVT